MFKKINYIPSVAILLIAASLLLSSTNISNSADFKSNGNIIVEMTGFKSNEGVVLVALYNSADGFPDAPDKSSVIMKAKGTVSENKSTVEFKNVPYGIYAVSAYHDENNNGKVDTGMFGIPKEGLLYSNNARSKYGPPKFDDAKFELNSRELKLALTVVFY